LNGITFEEAEAPVFVGFTLTCAAVIVVLSVVPRTRAVSPLVTALAVAGLVPFSYVVEDVSLTVTFSPAEVNSPKPEDDTLLTVPTEPPAAGPDRALEPPPPNPGRPPDAAVVKPVVPEAELDVPPQAASPIVASSNPAVAAVERLSRRLKGVCWRVMVFFPFSNIGFSPELLSASPSRTYGPAGDRVSQTPRGPVGQSPPTGSGVNCAGYLALLLRRRGVPAWEVTVGSAGFEGGATG
jgi:hypothetical protein